jgi:hypothetical protein
MGAGFLAGASTRVVDTYREIKGGMTLSRDKRGTRLLEGGRLSRNVGVTTQCKGRRKEEERKPKTIRQDGRGEGRNLILMKGMERVGCEREKKIKT